MVATEAVVLPALHTGVFEGASGTSCASLSLEIEIAANVGCDLASEHWASLVWRAALLPLLAALLPLLAILLPVAATAAVGVATAAAFAAARLAAFDVCNLLFLLLDATFRCLQLFFNGALAALLLATSGSKSARRREFLFVFVVGSSRDVRHGVDLTLARNANVLDRCIESEATEAIICDELLSARVNRHETWDAHMRVEAVELFECFALRCDAADGGVAVH